MTLDKIITHAGTDHADVEIVYRDRRRNIQATTYASILHDARRFSAGLIAHGIRRGDRVASLMWNDPDHLLTWYGTMSIGAVLHTLNPRVGADRLAWLIAKSAPRILVVEQEFLPLIASIAERVRRVELVIVASDDPVIPAGDPRSIGFDDFLANAVHPEAVRWGDFDENSAAGLCFTSGTTGDPKGVLYSHRSNFLHGLMINQAAGFGLTHADVVLPIVPMFHANAWALTFAAPMVGAALALPGPYLDGESLSELIDRAGVTFAAGVPTVLGDLLRHLRATGNGVFSIRRMVVGGSAITGDLITGFAHERGVEMIHGWGMTELSPLGSVSRSPVDDPAVLLRQGRAIFPVRATIVDADGEPCPHDDTTRGFLKVSGPTVVKRYFGEDQDAINDAGLFDTGDIAVVDADGSVRIVDRAKDVIKSGGEWISSIELEEAALGHPSVRRAAVIAVSHEKWTERPLLVIEAADGVEPDCEAIAAHLATRVPKWWVPERIVVRPIPLGPTGKIDKVRLRADFAEFTASPAA